MILPATAARAALATVLVAGGGLLAACGSSGGSSAAPTATVTVTAPPTSSPATSAPASTAQPGSGTSSTPQAGPPGCATSALHAQIGSGNGAAGSTIVPIEFTNQSTATCSLFGYPGVSFVTKVGGSQIGASADQNPGTPRKLVTLAPGAEAHALLQVVVAQNFPAAKCKLVKAHWLKVYPPGQTAPLYLSFDSDTCSSPSKAVRVLNVETVQPGDGANS
jgi:hypothetical protein